MYNARQRRFAPRLGRVRALGRRRTREAEGCFWVEGVRHFVQAVDAGHALQAVIHSPVLLKVPLAQMLVRRLRAAGVRSVRVSPEEFRAISTAERASGVGAVVRQRWTPLAAADPRRGLCWLVVEQLRSPGNLGTILRTAEAVGVGGVVFLGDQSDPFHPSTLRAGMGAVLHVPMVRASHDELRSWASAHDVQLAALSPDAPRLWTELSAASPVALILGEERQGLSERLQSLCHTTIRLPMTGQADSLNVGVAAGVMMYELVRRRCC